MDRKESIKKAVCREKVSMQKLELRKGILKK